MGIKKSYDEIYHGRRLVVVRHTHSEWEFMQYWYCGYMQILPSDRNYSNVLENHGYEIYPSSPAEINYAQKGLPFEWLGDDEAVYIGFDTAHFATRDYTGWEVLRFLKYMVDVDQEVINRGDDYEGTEEFDCD